MRKPSRHAVFLLLWASLISLNSFSAFMHSSLLSLSEDTVLLNGKTLQIHQGWNDGRIPEFSTAYTLQRHEFRLNVIGRSSFAFSNRFEVSSYLPLILVPNLAFKYRFIDRPHFASAIELGTAGGLFPVALFTGILLPGAAVGGGTLGILHGSDNHVKLFLSLHASDKLTFSVRGSLSTINIGYTGIVGVAGIGGDGEAAGLLPVRLNARYTWFMAGFETDYLLNPTNVLVLNTSIGGFDKASKQLGVASLLWTHARIHFHYSVGLYGFYDPPTWEIVKSSKLPISVMANVYWIFNNCKGSRP
jgi:hypothetical protein